MIDDSIDPAFRVHMLNDAGKEKAETIARKFSTLLLDLSMLDATVGREGALVKTKLEEACFFAKKSMASQTANHQE
jgi:hypothetical protein